MLYEIEPRNNPNQDNFAYWENFLSEEEIEWVLNCPEWSNMEKAEVGGDRPDSVLDTKIRKSSVSWMLPNADNNFLWKRITDVVAEVNRTFFRFDLTGCYEQIQLGCYKEEDQGFYDWHIDNSVKDFGVPRKLSMSLLLSDTSEFKGGQLQLKIMNDNPITVEQKKGRAWFFPSYILHRVTPVTKGIRKSLVLWVGGPPFR